MLGGPAGGGEPRSPQLVGRRRDGVGHPRHGPGSSGPQHCPWTVAPGEQAPSGWPGSSLCPAARTCGLQTPWARTEGVIQLPPSPSGGPLAWDPPRFCPWLRPHPAHPPAGGSHGGRRALPVSGSLVTLSGPRFHLQPSAPPEA